MMINSACRPWRWIQANPPGQNDDALISYGRHERNVEEHFTQPARGDTIASMIRILGIDPGSRITGFGVVDSDGHYSRHIASGAIRLDGETLADKLGMIFREVSAVIKEYQPQEMAIEKVFMARNADSALKLGQARGAAICAGVMQFLPVAEYTPRYVKQSVVGTGGADKEQVQHMMKMLLKLSGKLQADAADALAIALCHAHTQTSNNRLAEARTSHQEAR